MDKPSRGERGRVWGLSIIVLILALSLPFVEHFGELVERGPCGTRAGWEGSILRASLAYQKLAAAGHRKPRPHWVTIVPLTKDRDPEDVLSNICRQRLYLAKLLTGLQAANLRLIVVDKYFSPLSCTDEGINQVLRQAFLASRVPVVVGQHTETRQDFEEEHKGTLTEPQKRGFDAACLYLAPALKLDQPSPSARIRYGLLRLNRDTRKLPLQWTTHISEEDIGSKPPQTLPTVSLVAASEIDRTPAGLERIERLQKRSTHPFTSFIPRDQIPTYSALDLICQTKQTPTVKWDACPPPESGVLPISTPIVMIGEDLPDRDQHDTEIGRVPGVVLQANYLESILDDRYLNPVPLAVAVVASLLSLAFIELLFWKTHPPELALLFALALTGILWISCYLLSALSGYFLSLWLPGLVFLAGRWMIARGHAWGQHS